MLAEGRLSDAALRYPARFRDLILYDVAFGDRGMFRSDLASLLTWRVPWHVCLCSVMRRYEYFEDAEYQNGVCRDLSVYCMMEEEV